MDRLLTIEEVAEVTRVSTNTLRYWRHKGKGPRGARMGGGKRLVYRESDVTRWVDEQFSKESA